MGFNDSLTRLGFLSMVITKKSKKKHVVYRIECPRDRTYIICPAQPGERSADGKSVK